MTTDEKIQLLLDKFESFEKRLDEVVADVKELKQGQAQLETKLETEATERRQWQAWLKNKVEVNHEETINKVVGLKIEIMHVGEKLDKLDKQGKQVRLLDKSYVSLHGRVSDMEDTIEEIKDKLDKAS